MSAEYPVVAFLQNCWFRPNTNPETIRMYLTNQKFRRILLSKSMSGGRLQRAFGQENYKKIWWDNASPGVGVVSSAKFPPNMEHMAAIVREHQPRAVVCFGNVALDGWTGVLVAQANIHDAQFAWAHGIPDIPWHICPHPNKFGVTQHSLCEFAREIISRYL